MTFQGWRFSGWDPTVLRCKSGHGTCPNCTVCCSKKGHAFWRRYFLGGGTSCVVRFQYSRASTSEWRLISGLSFKGYISHLQVSLHWSRLLVAGHTMREQNFASRGSCCIVEWIRLLAAGCPCRERLLHLWGLPQILCFC